MKYFWEKSIKYKLIASFALLISITFSLITYTNYNLTKADIRNRAFESELPYLISTIELKTIENVHRAIAISATMARDPFLVRWLEGGEGNQKDVKDFLGSVLTTHKVLQVFLVSERKSVNYTEKGIVKKMSPKDPFDLWYYNFLLKNKDYETNVSLSEQTEKLTLFINYRIQNLRNEILGVTGIGLDLSVVNDTIESENHKNINVFLIDHGGNIRVHRDKNLVQPHTENNPNKNLRSLPGIKVLSEKILTEKDKSSEYLDENNRKVFVISRYIPDIEWYLILEISENIMFEDIDKIFYRNLFLIIIITFISSVLIYYIAQSITNPIRKLALSARKIAERDYSIDITRESEDEVGDLARSFQEMRHEIRESLDTITQQKNELEDYSKNLEDKVHERTQALENERAKSEKLLLSILPKEITEELMTEGSSEPLYYPHASVVFTDFKGFTQIASDMTPKELVQELDKCFSYFDSVLDRNNLEKLKTIGDSYMFAGGIPKTNNTHAIDCVLASLEIQSFMNQMGAIRTAMNLPYWELRLGINTGPLVAGVIGEKKFSYDVWGDTVNLASRMESSGEEGKINISKDTYEYVKDFFECEYRGQVKAKNKGEIDMYFVYGIKKELSEKKEGTVPNQKFRDLMEKRRG